ncbi:MAG: TrkH family potassium uptake protein [Planctomycetaceae bacterium]
MNGSLVCRMLGYLSLLIGGAMLVALPWSFPACGQTLTFERASFIGMLQAIAVCAVTGIGLLLAGRNARDSMLRKEAFAVVGLGWLLSGMLGGLPYLLTPTFRVPGVTMSVCDAVFESISGFTTTGASVLTQLEVPPGIADCESAAVTGRIAYVPRSVLFWRSFTHWLGGMGIIVLFVAILGQLGAGGKALMRREVPGPLTDSVRPRVRETAMLMWSIYLVLTVVMTLILLLQGLNVFEALCHTFGTLATGGFSTRNASVGAFQSGTLEFIVIVFMILAGTNFNLYYLLLRRSSHSSRHGLRDRLGVFLSDPEYRTYIAFISISTLMLTVVLMSTGVYSTFSASLRHAAFNAVAVMTTTGFGTEDFSVWPEFARALLVLLMFVGGCSGSTGGGVKVIRFIVLWKVLKLEAERAFRPNLVQPIRIAGRRLDDSVGRDVLVYFCLICVIFATSWLLLIAFEPGTQWQGETSAEKLIDCAGAVASTLNNIGPGLGICGPKGNYTAFSEASKALLTLLMLLGRLELFAIIVLFTSGFWRVQ